MVSPKTLRATHDVASVGKNAERHAHPQALYCINCPVECIFRRGSCFLPTGTPGGRRANSGVFSIPESAGAGTGAQNRAECPGPGPPMPQELVIFYRTRPMVPAFLPKSSMQAPSAAEYSQKCTPHPTPGTRSKKTNSLDLPSCRRRPQGLPPKSFRRTEGPRRAKRAAGS